MKPIHVISSLLLGFTPLATAAGIPPNPDLLTITCLYTGGQCAQDKSYWFISTGIPTWNAALSKTNGCQPVNATWDITSAKAGYLADGCTLSFYTDKNCIENGAESHLDECVTSTAGWKSFAIRNCAATKG
ncbi:hypothetical protein QBC43DRAFT_353389 [Cladorrhinum sp. PSN259]|nr:hypothetical protein QBC43DRAFT_353389 [Cladorrhinum sp. PSN259]